MQAADATDATATQQRRPTRPGQGARGRQLQASNDREAGQPIGSKEDAERYLSWLENATDKYLLLERFIDNSDWEARLRELLRQFGRKDAAAAMKRVIGFLLHDQLQMPLYDRPVKQMLLPLLLRFPRIVYCMLRDNPAESNLVKFCLLLASMSDNEPQLSDPIEKLCEKLERIDDEIYVDALCNESSRQVHVSDILPTYRHDNDFADFRDLQICPTQEEVLCRQPPYLPDITEGSLVSTIAFVRCKLQQ